jgi:hypothetical protein
MPLLPLGRDPFCSMRIKTTWPTSATLAATMTPVRFADNTGPYRGGETARFLPEDAAVDAGHRPRRVNDHRDRQYPRRRRDGDRLQVALTPSPPHSATRFVPAHRHAAQAP